jgi:hypothetical protein
MSTKAETDISNYIETNEKKKSMCFLYIFIIDEKNCFLEDRLKKKKRKLENGNEVPLTVKKKAKKQKLEQQNGEEEESDEDEDLPSTSIDENKIQTTGK